MSEPTQTIQQNVHALAEDLPPDADEAHSRKAVELGIAAANRGSFATDEEVRKAFSRWGVKT